MKNKWTRRIALFLALLTAASFPACGKTEPQTEETVSETGTVLEETTDTTPETVAGPAVKDLNGYTLRYAACNGFSKYLNTTEQKGEAVNDALYNADAKVMEDFNCSLELVLLDDFPNITVAVEKAVQGGEDAYDLSYNNDNQTVANALKGYFLDIRSCPEFNFDAPWWTKTADSFTVNNHMYFASNYLTYSPLYLAMILCYNKDLAKDYNIEIPYDEIFAGNWYMEDLIAMVQDTTLDVNGDGDITLGEDQYGFISNALGLVNFQVSMGGTVLTQDEEGYLMLDVDKERLQTILETFEKLMEFGVDTIEDGKWDYGVSYFREGQALFNYSQITQITKTVKESDFSMGTLPVPKTDELQEEYITGAFDAYWGIPTTAYSNRDTIATILEAKAHQCYYNVLPVSFETALQVRFADSPEDAKTFEIIRDTMLVDIGYAFNEQNWGLADIIRIFSRSESGSLSSFIERVSKTAEDGLAQINNTYRELAARG